MQRSWHLLEALGVDEKGDSPRVIRVVFHEITKDAVNEAIANPRQISTEMGTGKYGGMISALSLEGEGDAAIGIAKSGDGGAWIVPLTGRSSTTPPAWPRPG